ncbi:hypothetical protein PV05_05003 [Exophiala xenobiotica]|uniref:Uncharacterized protein n=1 Tax=Exophiala xenobiotica TaxID=348802 RepID=A0A0D2D1P9_9EURO|nr:uncharacterized protein PV05_05003 [Exophiala xenobiotica]KIW56337.1 hypothetical protein PV05_05003 [Exophiala xenobiotica]
MSRSSRRGPWLPEEDATLLHLVRTQGPNNWVRISQHMRHRSPKQCRERYHQNLKPSLNHEPISPQEGEFIEQLVGEMGKRWAEIARRLGNRSDNAVKNWWNGSMNRRRRTSSQPGSGTRSVGYRIRPMPAFPPSRQMYLQQQVAPSHDAFGGSQTTSPPFPSRDGRSNSYSLSRNYQPPRQGYNSCSPTIHPHSSTSSHFQPAGHSQYPVSSESALLPRPAVSLPPQSRSLPPSLPRLHSFPAGPGLDRYERQLPPPHYIEAPIPSPAATEASHASSNQQAPSLISDNQSNCSISPKTLPSPRPGTHSSNAPSVQGWSEPQCLERAGSYQGGKSDMAAQGQGGGYFQLRPSSASNFISSGAPLLPALARPLSLPRLMSSPALEHTAPCKTPGEKDTRMDVSRLLE